jgi:hypothetical protein
MICEKANSQARLPHRLIERTTVAGYMTDAALPLVMALMLLRSQAYLLQNCNSFPAASFKHHQRRKTSSNTHNNHLEATSQL